MNKETFLEQIKKLFRNIDVYAENDENIIFSFREHQAELSKERLERIFQNLENYNSEQETELYNENNLEVLVKFDLRRPISYREREADRFCKTDEINKINYTLFAPSDEYLVYIIDKLNELIPERELRRAFSMSSYRVDRYFRNPEREEDFTPDFLDLLKQFLRIDTLSVESENKKGRKELESLAYAYMYNLGINLDFPIYPLRYVDEFTSRARRLRRASPDEIEAPKRIYINDLVLHYQRGLFSASIDNQFLSYYHVMEHFFEVVYNEDLLNSVKRELSKATFSYKRKKDVNSIIDLIKKKLKYKNDEFQLHEEEALILTLTKFVNDVEEFKSELNQIDSELIEYYKTTDVPFSKGNKVNLDVENTEDIFKNLGRRIYKTRNSIVHSKENEREKYLPFKDDKELIKEIPLMRIIAEKIIFESSKEL